MKVVTPEPLSTMDMILLLTLNTNGESTLGDLEFAYGIINEGEVMPDVVHEIISETVASLEKRGMAKVGPSVIRLTSKGHATASMVSALNIVMDDIEEEEVVPTCNCPPNQSN